LLGLLTFRMKQKKNVSDKLKKIKIVPSLISKKINLNNIKIPQIISIKETKDKIGKFYEDYKKTKKIEEIKVEKKRVLEEKKKNY